MDKLASEVEQGLVQTQTRRHFLGGGMSGLGALFLATTMGRAAAAGQEKGVAAGGSARLDFARSSTEPLAALPPQFTARARRIIFLHMAGAPSQHELFEHKPVLNRFDGQDCPASFLEGRRFRLINGVPKLMGSQYPLHQTGQSGAWISDRLPHLERHMDQLCFIRSMRSDQFNHAPAQLLAQTGHALAGHPALGSWVTYGLGSENRNLPGFIVLLSGVSLPEAGKHLWSAGYLPGVYQGVQCRSQGEPVLYLNDPPGVSRPLRRRMLDLLDEVNRKNHERFGNPETLTRIAQYEMAFRMQMQASEAMDIRREPRSVLESYGAEPGKSSYANNCLVARRLAERDVRFIQLYHQGWDSHGSSASEALNIGFVDRCRETDRATAALLADLQSSGLLDDTLVVWGGEFGRTPMRENRGGQQNVFLGRDHNPASFTIWLAGGGVKPGMSYGQTDDIGFEVVKDPVEVRDLHATLLYLLGFDYHKLNYPYQGLDQKLTGVKAARVVAEILT